MEKQKRDDLSEYAEEKQPFDDVMRQLLQAKPNPRKAAKPKTVKIEKPKRKKG